MGKVTLVADMHVFSLDVSTKTGYSYFENGKLKEYGLITLDDKLKNMSYPEEFVKYADRMATKIKQTFEKVVAEDFWDQGMLVLEETSIGRAVYQHKILEFIHCLFLKKFVDQGYVIKYVRTGSWRSAVGLKLTTEDKKHNADVRKKKAKGLITKKHLSVRMANKEFDLELKLKDNDISDSLLIGFSAYKGVTFSKGMGEISAVKEAVNEIEEKQSNTDK